MKPLLVGELNPYGADPKFALYHLPRGASGDRLREIMGLTDVEYMRGFDRVNLCMGRWSMPAARVAAQEIRIDPDHRVLVLLGKKVCDAFKVPYVPFWSGDVYGPVMRSAGVSQRMLKIATILPHPSGLSRAWNDPGAKQKAREALTAGHVLPLAQE